MSPERQPRKRVKGKMAQYSDRFEVSIDVRIAKKDRGYQGQEAISYGEKFEIPAHGWAQVAKILGDLNKVVGIIQKEYPPEDISRS